jgi:hypothetical protein
VILLNFSHPLTADHLAQLATRADHAVDRVVDVPVQFDVTVSFETQVRALVDGIGLSPVEWQTAPILVNPPALNVIAVTLLAELHGRMGYFPPVVRLRPMAGSLPPRFEVAEIINLQAMREQARIARQS